MFESFTPKPDETGQSRPESQFTDLDVSYILQPYRPETSPNHDFVTPAEFAETVEVIVFEQKKDNEPPMSWQDAMTA